MNYLCIFTHCYDIIRSATNSERTTILVEVDGEFLKTSPTRIGSKNPGTGLKIIKLIHVKIIRVLFKACSFLNFICIVGEGYCRQGYECSQTV